MLHEKYHVKVTKISNNIDFFALNPRC